MCLIELANLVKIRHNILYAITVEAEKKKPK